MTICGGTCGNLWDLEEHSSLGEGIVGFVERMAPMQTYQEDVYCVNIPGEEGRQRE